MKLDHCVLPSANLAIARELLTRLGFTVAPDAAHPFGITSCRVFFEDGSYLESVVLADKNAARRASAAGNVFVQRDRRFRDAGGDEGFSALAFGTDDAALDHIRFVDGEMSAGDPLSFSRPFPDSSGNKTEASFKLAFAAPEDAPSFFFTCERVKTPAVDCSTLCQHANHVSGILRILVTASEPRAAGTFLSQFLQTGSGGGVWPLDNVVLSLLTDAKQVYNMDPDSDGNLRPASVKALAERLVVAQIAHTMHRGRLVVPPAPGQGAYFFFEEPPKSSVAEAILEAVLRC